MSAAGIAWIESPPPATGEFWTNYERADGARFARKLRRLAGKVVLLGGGGGTNIYRVRLVAVRCEAHPRPARNEHGRIVRGLDGCAKADRSKPKVCTVQAVVRRVGRNATPTGKREWTPYLASWIIAPLPASKKGR